jgi:hypothetical protein
MNVSIIKRFLRRKLSSPGIVNNEASGFNSLPFLSLAYRVSMLYPERQLARAIFRLKSQLPKEYYLYDFLSKGKIQQSIENFPSTFWCMYRKILHPEIRRAIEEILVFTYIMLIILLISVDFFSDMGTALISLFLIASVTVFIYMFRATSRNAVTPLVEDEYSPNRDTHEAKVKDFDDLLEAVHRDSPVSDQDQEPADPGGSEDDFSFLEYQGYSRQPGIQSIWQQRLRNIRTGDADVQNTLRMIDEHLHGEYSENLEELPPYFNSEIDFQTNQVDLDTN